MPFGTEGKALVKILYEFKEYGSRRILAEFSKIHSKTEGLGTSLQNIREIGSTDQRHKSGSLKHARTEKSMTAVDEQMNWY